MILSREQMEALLIAYPPLDTTAARGADRADNPHNNGRAKATSHDHGQQGRPRNWIADVSAYLREHDIAVASERDGSEGEHIFVLAACVWDASHTDHAAWVIQRGDGTVVAGCSHHSCEGKRLAEFRDVVEGPDWRTGGERGGSDGHDGHGTTRPPSQADDLKSVMVAIFGEDGAAAHSTGADGAPPRAELFHDPSGEPYATVPLEAHHETLHLHSRAMQLWAKHEYFRTRHKMVDQHALTQVLGWLEARARFEGPMHPVHLRLAQLRPDEIWLDLGDPTHQAVHITSAGWRLVAHPPVKFRRVKGLQALPLPESPHAHETLESLLRPLVNLPEGEQTTWVLLVTWLLATLRPAGPFPVMQLRGEQGSAKSTLGRVLRRLVDPCKVELDSEPHDLRDLAISADNSWLLAYDNLSRVSPWLSDALCRLSTGGGFRTRQLFTDDEEALFSYTRPVLLTGVDDVVTRPDLLDRTISITLPVIPTGRRRTEAAFWQEFEVAAPRILGALLDALSGALAALPHVQPDKLPRMADFAAWATAVEQALHWPVGTFAAAYDQAHNDAQAVALEASPVADILVGWIKRAGEWTGTMDQLLHALNEEVTTLDGEKAPRRLGWPRTARGLSGAVGAIQPYLRQLGIEVVREPVHGARNYRITYRPPAAESAAAEDSAAEPPRDPPPDDQPSKYARRARIFDNR